MAVAKLIVAGLLTFASPTFSSGATPENGSSGSELPEVSVLDWTAIGILPEKQRLATVAMNLARRTIIETLITNAQPVEKLLPKIAPPLTLNQEKLLAGVRGGQRSSTVPAAAKTLIVLPVWCSIGNYDLIFLGFLDGADGHLISAPHFAVERGNWARYLKTNGLATNLSEPTRRLITQGLAQTSTPRGREDALQLQLDLARETTRADQGSSLCLNFRLAAELSGKFKLLPPAGNEMWAALRRAFNTSPKPMRSTRRVVLTWNANDAQNVPQNVPRYGRVPTKQGQSMKLPVTIPLTARWAEAVLGQRLRTPKTQTSPIQLSSLDRKSVVMQGIEPLLQIAEAQRRALLLSEAPQVSKIEGAWAYVDKGRAWGLQLDDRLIVESGAETIKGHVVGFYGPELGIQSPRGYPVEEGAIIFIRKGQKTIKPGMNFAFDKAAYPTPWPPAAAH